MIQVNNSSEAERLQGQLRVLDSLRQPQVVDSNLAHISEALEPGNLFEWIAARHPFRDLSAEQLATAVHQLEQLAAPAAQLRLLFSQPQLGPAAALLSIDTLPTPLRTLLEPLLAQEAQWMAPQPNLEHLSGLLSKHGWQLSWQPWSEALELSLSAGLIERWLGADAPYRRQLSRVLTPAQLQRLEQELHNLVGCRLPQQLEHRLLSAHHRPRTAGAAGLA